MKTFFVTAFVAIASFLASPAAFAKDVTVGEGENKPVMVDGDNYAVGFVAGDVVSTSESWVSICPPANPNAVHCLGLMRETTVRVKFTLNGCLDTLGPVSSQTIRETNTGDILAVSVAAIQIQNKGSILARCTAMPTAFANIKVRGEYLDLDAAKNIIQFVGFKQEVLVK